MINDNEKIKTKSRAPKRFDVTLSLARYFHPIPQFSTSESIVGVHMSFFFFFLRYLLFLILRRIYVVISLCSTTRETKSIFIYVWKDKPFTAETQGHCNITDILCDKLSVK